MCRRSSTPSSRSNHQPSMICASSRAELSERCTAIHGRPAPLVPIVTQLVTQLGCRTLKRNFGCLSHDLRQLGRRAGRARSWAHVVDGWLPTFHAVLCPVCAPANCLTPRQRSRCVHLLNSPSCAGVRVHCRPLLSGHVHPDHHPVSHPPCLSTTRLQSSGRSIRRARTRVDVGR